MNASHRPSAFVAGIGMTPTGKFLDRSIKQLTADGQDASVAIKSTRNAYFADAGGYVETPCYDRAKLSAGASFFGPAIVEDIDSTAVIGPGTRVDIDRYANLVVTFL